MLTLAATAEHRFSRLPVSVYGRLRWDGMTHGGNLNNSNSTEATVGIRFYFDGQSPLDNDRNGAPMDTLPFPFLLGLNFG